MKDDIQKMEILLKSEIGLKAGALYFRKQDDFARIGDVDLIKSFGLSEKCTQDDVKGGENPEIEGLDPEKKKLLNELLGKDDRPPKEWWDRCMSKAGSFASDPAKYCGALWHRPEEQEGGEERREAFGKAKCPCEAKKEEVGAGERDMPGYGKPRPQRDLTPRDEVTTN